jgi:glycosyltransferase involved in cell wall biosynthesis
MKALRLLAILEANTTTGPAKNLLQFANCARSQSDPRVEVAIALFERRGAPNLLRDIAAQSGIPAYPILEERRFDRAVIPQIRAAIEHYRADVIQSHSVKSHFLVRAGGLDRMAPWVAFHHGYTWPDLRMRFYNQLDRWSLRGARRVLTVSRPFREELVARGVDPDRITVVHNAIDPIWGTRATPEQRLETRARLGIEPGRKVVLTVGRLSLEKDHATLLRAFHGLHLKGGATPRPHLVLVGDGPERQRILDMARSLGLSGSVTLTGQVPTAEPFYGVADVAVLSSRSEGSPNALLEAMAAGVPVVATAVGGVPEMVSHLESAYLVEPGDAKAMASGIESVMTDEGLASKLAERARRLVVAGHTPAARTRRLAGAYLSALNLDRCAASLPHGLD